MSPARPIREREIRPVALVTDSGPTTAGEDLLLLRNRLRVAVLLTLGGVLLSWLHDLGYGTAGMKPFLSAFLAFMLTGVGFLTAFLWTSWPFSLRQLRVIELAVIGIPAAFLAYLQNEWVRDDWLGRLASAWPDDPRLSLEVMDLAADSSVLPWFGLIVIYGCFIPNGWKRCACIVAVLALTPLAVTALAGWSDHSPYNRALLCGLGEMAVWLAVASAAAVVGSHKLSALRREAFEFRKLGQYRLTERLGAGGMGEVYLAEHVLLRRPCALKLISPDRAGDRETLRRFEREVRVMATLTHWNTVEIYDYGHTEDGTFFYVMEYLPGLSLQDLVDRHGPLPPARAVYLLRQVCGALGEAHGVGLIHRDIKPGNVIACRRGGLHDVAKLLDFGLVQVRGPDRPVEKLTMEGMVVGTPEYMAPEQATGQGPVDARSDIYSLGAVAYYLLTGQPPFVRDSDMQVMAAHLLEPVVRPSKLRPDLPADLQEVIMRCLEKEPGRRHADATHLEESLARCGCAGQWGPRQAAEWWHAHPVRDPVASPHPLPRAKVGHWDKRFPGESALPNDAHEPGHFSGRNEA